MSLDSEVKARWSSQILINASNPQDSDATSIDQSRLDEANNDVVAAFKIYCGTTYDTTLDTHNLVATHGVLVRLLVITGQTDLHRWDEWKQELRELALVTGRDRISPSTDSNLDPTTDRTGDRPSADRSNFERYIPNAPGNQTTTNRNRTTTD
jgi:hypothetical protein